MRTLSLLLKWVFWLFVAALFVALIVFLIGWLGKSPDPLGAVYLVLLGMPWILFLDGALASGPATVFLANAINMLILLSLWQIAEKLARRSQRTSGRPPRR